MATGDILSVVINADGCTATITIEGLAPGGTYDWGWGNGNALPETPAVKFRVPYYTYNDSGSGSVAGPLVRDVYGTNVLEDFTTPANVQESVSGSDVVIVIGLSDTICRHEDVAHTGQSIEVDIKAGWYTQGGTPNAVYDDDEDGNVTNSSTVIPTKGLAQWDCYAGVMTGDRVTDSTFTVACHARHPFGIACVVFDAEGITSANTAQVVVTEETPAVRTATGLSVSSFQATFNSSAFNDGEQVEVRFRVYPKQTESGLGVIDSHDYIDPTQEVWGRNTIVIHNDPDSSADLFAYVDSGSGSDTFNASRDGTIENALLYPFATIGGAIDDGYNRIKLADGAHNMVGVSPTRLTEGNSNGWVIVEPYNSSSTTPYNATVLFELRGSPFQDSYNCERLSFENVNVAKNTKDSNLDGDEVNYLRFKNCHWLAQSLAADNIPICFRTLATYFINCTGALSRNDFSLLLYTATDEYGMAQFDGCNFTGNDGGSPINIACRFVANYIEGSIQLSDYEGNTKAVKTDGAIIESNKWVNFDVVSYPISITKETLLGYCICNNDIEYIGASEPVMMFIGGESGGSDVDINYMMIYNDTVAGERCNFGYNDDGTSPAATRIGWYIRYCLLEEFNNKGYEFTGDPDDNGTVPLRFGAGISDNQYQHTKGYHAESTLTGAGGFNGINVWVGADQDEPTPFVDDNSATGDGSGEGDYRPNTDAPAYLGVRASSFANLTYQIPYDILGNPRDLENGDHMGAYAFVSTGGWPTRGARTNMKRRAQAILGRSGPFQ